MKISRSAIYGLVIILFVAAASIAVTYCIIANKWKVKPAYEVGTVLTDGKALNVITHLFQDKEPVYGIIKLISRIDTITQEVSFIALPFTQNVRDVDIVTSVKVLEIEDIKLLYGLNPMFIEIPK